MAKENSNPMQRGGKTNGQASSYPLLSVFFGLTGILLFISLLAFEPNNMHSAGTLDLGATSKQNISLLGKAGDYLSYYTFAFFGMSAWLMPWFFCTISYLYVIKIDSFLKFQKIGSLALFVCGFCTLLNIHFANAKISQIFISGPGGYVGGFLYSGLPVTQHFQFPNGIFSALGPLGATLFMLGLSVIALFFHFSISTTSIKGVFKIALNLLNFRAVKKSSNRVTPSLPDRKGDEDKFSIYQRLKSLFLTTGGKEDNLLFEDVSKHENIKFDKSENKATVSKSKPEKSDEFDKKLKDSNLIPDEKSIKPDLSDTDKNENKLISNSENESDLDGFKVVRAAKTEKSSDLFPERKGDYHFPNLDLLMDPPEEQGSEDEDHMIKARNLKETLSEFKVDIELGEVHTGPVITRYDVHPAAGVRVEKIANLDKNLAMALRADSVRILAPVPGKGCVGIEVPNQNPAAVCLKEILQSKAWANSGAEIPIVLGKEASGKALVADLTKMPHLLVAGSTGSGKTVCINAIIASLCYHSSPADVRFIMVDPKIVEMKVYNDLPHMLIPVVTEPKKVPGALKWLLAEMERRYQIFSKVGVRNIAGFNAKILRDKEEKEKAQALDADMTAEERAALSNIEVPRDDDILEIPENKLPYIVCIIDELADLMMVAQADVETGIARLAQLARAAGIHLIIATQRPSVNVITGVIKANLPSRISFRVASYRDSQTILDGKGAEALIGKGDMLFIPPGSSTFVRAQGAFVSDDEINGIVEFLKVNGPPQIIEEVREQIDAAGEGDILGDGNDDENEDPMLRKAIEVIRTTKRASTSNLQRKLSIGYNRAARIMDELEDRGLIGPDIPGQGREILMDL